MWQYNLTPDMTDLENKLRSTWNQKLARIAGHGKSPEEGLERLGKGWEKAWPYIEPRDSLDGEGTRNDYGARAFKYLKEIGVHSTAFTCALDAMRQKKGFLQEEVAASVAKWQVTECGRSTIELLYDYLSKETGEVDIFLELINCLEQWREMWLRPFVPSVQPLVQEGLRTRFNFLLFSILPPGFPELLKAWLERSLDEDVAECTAIFRRLDTFGFIHHFQMLIGRVAYGAIEKKIQDHFSRMWKEACLKDILQWASNDLTKWANAVFPPLDRPDKSAPSSAPYAGQTLARTFEYHVHKVLCDLRISELFDIIVDYPDSTNALTDLQACMGRTIARDQLVSGLRHQTQKRLLHPGADTKDIISHYVSTMKCLRIIDPPGVLLYRVADPVRRYLRERPDTIKCIVESLVTEGSDLAGEAQVPIVAEFEHEDYSNPNWKSEPPDAGPRFRWNKPTDIVSTLVNIYDSRELFIRELSQLFSYRLMHIRDGDLDGEKRHIEILKLRFGDAALQSPDVMLSDMQFSVRLNKQIATEGFPHPMDTAVLSRWFWPTMPEEASALKLPGPFKQMQQEFEERYSRSKTDRRLHWLTTLGSVTITIQLADRTFKDIEVSPVQAAVAQLFSEKPEWTTEALIEELGAEKRMLEEAVTAWVDRGMIGLDEGRGVWVLYEREGDKPSSKPKPIPFLIPKGAAGNPGHLTPPASKDPLWGWLLNLFRNLGPQTTEALYSRVSSAYRGPVKTREELEQFLQRKAKEGQARFEKGQWDRVECVE